jgi:hypothetical protein
MKIRIQTAFFVFWIPHIYFAKYLRASAGMDKIAGFNHPAILPKKYIVTYLYICLVRISLPFLDAEETNHLYGLITV